MNSNSMVSLRKAFSSRLLENAKKDKRIFATATDSRGSVTIGEFAEQLPNQFVEFGIAEQNSIAAAAGMAKTDKNVFVTGPASFLSARAYEQIKVDVAYNRTNVKIIGVSAGVSYGPLGCTHTTMHDFAGMRALPNIGILAPSDAVQTEWLTDYLCGTEGPFYMRMGRGDVASVYEQGTTFQIGEAKMLQDGTDLTIITCGEMVAPAIAAGRRLREKGLSVRVLDMFCLRPLDEKAIVEAIVDTKAIITVEEHSTHGGLGEAVAHMVAEAGGCKMRILGLPEEVIIGNSHDIFTHYGLTETGIAKVAFEIVR